MKTWNQNELYNLDYIEEQAKAIKAQHNMNNSATEKKRTEMEVLEEQLMTLQQMQTVLEAIEQSLAKKGWRKFL